MAEWLNENESSASKKNENHFVNYTIFFISFSFGPATVTFHTINVFSRFIFLIDFFILAYYSFLFLPFQLLIPVEPKNISHSPSVTISPAEMTD